MFVAITLFGRELLSLHIAFDTDPEPVESDDAGDNAGGTYVGFVASHERPDESGLPYNDGWD